MSRTMLKTANSWISVAEGTNAIDLVNIIKNADVWFADLDGTEVDSAKRYARNFVFDIKNFVGYKDYLPWLVEGGIRYLFTKKEDMDNLETEMWGAFVNLFLKRGQDDDRLERIRKSFMKNGVYDTEKIRSRLYPGVFDQHQYLDPKMFKVCITRNIKELTEPYVGFLGYSLIECEKHTKLYSIKNILEMMPKRDFVVFKDDSLNDEEEILGYLDFMKEGVSKSRRIQDYVSIFVSEEPEEKSASHLNLKRKDQSALVDLMRII